MTMQILTLPYERTSPLYIPQRDLVVSAADSLTLRVTVIENDTPTAQALVLTGGVGGPTCMLLVYPDSYGVRLDYGAPRVSPGTTLWAGMGTISPQYLGSFDIFLHAGTMAGWPRRCRWSIMLDWNGGSHAELLSEGYLHVRPTGQRYQPEVTLNTDEDVPILVNGG